jgi:methionine--tRNA ligase beta chain
MISYDDFKKLDIRIGKIIKAEKIEKSEKLLKLMVDLGEGELRQIIAGIALAYPDITELTGKEIPILANLEPKDLMGFTSYGMILAADNQGTPTLLNPGQEVPPGSTIK